VREVERGKQLVVVYQEQEHDGFIIAAFDTRRLRWLEGRERIWP
jgi:hypothetical protein